MNAGPNISLIRRLGYSIHSALIKAAQLTWKTFHLGPDELTKASANFWKTRQIELLAQAANALEANRHEDADELCKQANKARERCWKELTAPDA